MPFDPLQSRPKQASPVIALDLGFSRKRPSCGLYWTGAVSGINRRFGRACEEVHSLLSKEFAAQSPLLLVEAPLSKLITVEGQPELRDVVESGRAWYWQAGAGMSLGAMELLRRLNDLLKGDPRKIPVMEAFAPTPDLVKAKVLPVGADHKQVAKYIHDHCTTVRLIAPNGWEPLSPLLSQAPAILRYP